MCIIGATVIGSIKLTNIFDKIKYAKKINDNNDVIMSEPSFLNQIKNK